MLGTRWSFEKDYAKKCRILQSRDGRLEKKEEEEEEANSKRGYSSTWRPRSFSHLGFRFDDFRDNYQRDAEKRNREETRVEREERMYQMNLYAYSKGARRRR